MARPNTNRSGDRAELIAAVWLMDRGYQVFRNVSCSGPVDLVAWDPATGEKLMIDVKSSTSNCATLLAGGIRAWHIIKVKRHPEVCFLYVRDGVVAGFLRRCGPKMVEEYWPGDESQPD